MTLLQDLTLCKMMAEEKDKLTEKVVELQEKIERLSDQGVVSHKHRDELEWTRSQLLFIDRLFET